MEKMFHRYQGMAILLTTLYFDNRSSEYLVSKTNLSIALMLISLLLFGFFSRPKVWLLLLGSFCIASLTLNWWIPNSQNVFVQWIFTSVGIVYFIQLSTNLRLDFFKSITSDYLILSGFIASLWTTLSIYGYSPYYILFPEVMQLKQIPGALQVITYDESTNVGILGNPIHSSCLMALGAACTIFWTQRWYTALFFLPGIWFSKVSTSSAMLVSVFQDYLPKRLKSFSTAVCLLSLAPLIHALSRSDLLSGNGRFGLWRRVAFDFSNWKLRLLGAGPGFFPDAFSAAHEAFTKSVGVIFLQCHNEFLEAYSMLGLSGVFCCLAIFVIAIRNILQKDKRIFILFIPALLCLLTGFPLHLAPLNLAVMLLVALPLSPRLQYPEVDSLS